MKITGFNIQMGAKSVDYQMSRNVRAQLSGPSNNTNVHSARSPNATSDIIAGAAPKSNDSSLPGNLYVLKQLLEYLTGHKINEITPEDLTGTTAAPQTSSPQTQANSNSQAPSETPLVYEENTSLRYQSADFSAQAHIKTSDGQEFNIKLNEHQEQLEFNQEVYIGAPRDPLILRTGTQPISSTRTNNGIPVLSGGAYIAYDANGNNTIDGPEEMLGYKSGDAFADLKALDSDGNSWIDEGDAAWSKLYTWDGSTGSSGFKSAGVGALFTGAVGTHYEQGLLTQRQKGVALMEDGTARVITRVDINA